MRRWLLILLVCVAAVSCRWWHETFDDPGECAEWYLDELYEAAVDGDVSKFRERVDDINEWEAGLSASESEEVVGAVIRYSNAHPSRVEKITNFANEHNILLE